MMKLNVGFANVVVPFSIICVLMCYMCYVFLLLKYFSLGRVPKLGGLYPDGIAEGNRVTFEDPYLLRHIRDQVLVPPSIEDYNLTTHNFTEFSHTSEKFYSKYLRIILSESKNGFFVEAGALDGEKLSNTLWLEVERGWSGLLVEPFPESYEHLKAKNRKSWSANCCLSVEKYPKTETLGYETFTRVVSLAENHQIWAFYKGTSFVKEKDSANSTDIPKRDAVQNYRTESYNATCYPLASLLLALGTNRVDLLSLDVEGAEDRILETFDFKKFNVHVIFLEWTTRKRDKTWLRDFLGSRDYILVDNVKDDFVFVRRWTRYEQIARQKKLIK